MKTAILNLTALLSCQSKAFEFTAPAFSSLPGVHEPGFWGRLTNSAGGEGVSKHSEVIAKTGFFWTDHTAVGLNP